MGADIKEPVQVQLTQDKDDKGPSWSDIGPFFGASISIIGFLFLSATDNVSWAIWFGFVVVPI